MLRVKLESFTERRAALNLSQRELSKRARLAPNSVYRIESGESGRISELRAESLARCLKCRVADIFDRL